MCKKVWSLLPDLHTVGFCFMFYKLLIISISVSFCSLMSVLTESLHFLGMNPNTGTSGLVCSCFFLFLLVFLLSSLQVSLMSKWWLAVPTTLWPAVIKRRGIGVGGGVPAQSHSCLPNDIFSLHAFCFLLLFSVREVFMALFVTTRMVGQTGKPTVQYASLRNVLNLIFGVVYNVYVKTCILG